MPVLKADSTLAATAAIELAREAAVSIAEPDTVGEHVAMVMEAERLATHYFRCTSSGYQGWRWSVSVARSPRQKHATICETSLVPGEGAILAPEWVPYAERIAPGDLGAGDVLPYRQEDPNLQPGFEATGEEDIDALAINELGLGRKRVLSPEGREAAAQRWYDGEHGPRSEVAEKAPARCVTCGYFVPMAGALRRTFGVCANEWSPSDGKVVSLDHGCGAHSEADVAPQPPSSVGSPIVDEYAVEMVQFERPAAAPAAPTAELSDVAQAAEAIEAVETSESTDVPDVAEVAVESGLVEVAPAASDQAPAEQA